MRTLREANRLSKLLCSGYVSSYLQVLDAERDLFYGGLGLAQTTREELRSVVRLYRSLGGWRR